MQPHVHNSPRLTVDPLLFCVDQKQLKVLVITRAKDPEKDKIALPGGGVESGQTTKEALDITLHTRAGVAADDLSYINQLHFFDAKNLDPRGHAVTLVYQCLAQITPTIEERCESPRFMDVDSLDNTMAFDHISIVKLGLDRLNELLRTTTIARYMLPKCFTLNELHELYEIVLKKAFDNRNFRKKFLSFGVLKDSGTTRTGLASRPARLYSFAGRKVESLVNSFD